MTGDPETLGNHSTVSPHLDIGHNCQHGARSTDRLLARQCKVCSGEEFCSHFATRVLDFHRSSLGRSLSILLLRHGPLGYLNLRLYASCAMMIGQFILSLPIIINLTVVALQQLNPSCDCRYGRLAPRVGERFGCSVTKSDCRCW